LNFSLEKDFSFILLFLISFPLLIEKSSLVRSFSFRFYVGFNYLKRRKERKRKNLTDRSTWDWQKTDFFLLKETKCPLDMTERRCGKSFKEETAHIAHSNHID
jgi:hypothetical protein